MSTPNRYSFSRWLRESVESYRLGAALGLMFGSAVALVAARRLHDYWRYDLLERFHHALGEDVVYFVGMLVWSAGGVALGGFIAGAMGRTKGLRQGMGVSLIVLAVSFALLFGLWLSMDPTLRGNWSGDFQLPWHRNQTLWTVLGALLGGPVGGIAGERLARRSSGSTS